MELYLAAILRTLGHGVAVVDMSADKKYKYHTSSIDMNEKWSTNMTV